MRGTGEEYAYITKEKQRRRKNGAGWIGETVG